MTEEARIEHSDVGAYATSPGWFVLNIADARWEQAEEAGHWTDIEPPGGFEHYGIGIHVLQPGQPNGKYHSENFQEDFLVLSGECVLVIEGEERPLKAWDFVHCPPGSDHIFVGAGDGPCVIVMAGARSESNVITYPRDETALRHGAGVETETQKPREAYAPFPQWSDGPPASWDGTPWSDAP